MIATTPFACRRHGSSRNESRDSPFVFCLDFAPLFRIALVHGEGRALAILETGALTLLPTQPALRAIAAD
jgi:hypothetical protein